MQIDVLGLKTALHRQIMDGTAHKADRIAASIRDGHLSLHAAVNAASQASTTVVICHTTLQAMQHFNHLMLTFRCSVGHARWYSSHSTPDCCCMPTASETVVICPSQALCAGFRCSVGHAQWYSSHSTPDCCCMPKASKAVIICPSQALCVGFRRSLGHT